MRPARAMTLLEVLVSQTIALVAISAMLSVVVAMVKKVESETAASDAQIRLRQVTQLMLRDAQGVGGSTVATAGDLVFVTDGGSSGADQLMLFKRDESSCMGGLAVTGTAGNTINVPDIDTDPSATTTMDCPIDSVQCPASDIAGRDMLVIGASKNVMMRGHNANGSSCKINYPTGAQAGSVVARYNARYDPDVANINLALDAIAPTAVMVGSAFTYRLNGTALQRSTDSGETFVDVLDNVHDLQIERIYGLEDGTLVTVNATSGTALPAGVTENDFLGLRIGLITWASAKDGLKVPPPATFGNRSHTSAPTNRRYRASFVLAASRNRTGA